MCRHRCQQCHCGHPVQILPLTMLCWFCLAAASSNQPMGLTVMMQLKQPLPPQHATKSMQQSLPIILDGYDRDDAAEATFTSKTCYKIYVTVPSHHPWLAVPRSGLLSLVRDAVVRMLCHRRNKYRQVLSHPRSV